MACETRQKGCNGRYRACTTTLPSFRTARARTIRRALLPVRNPLEFFSLAGGSLTHKCARHKTRAFVVRDDNGKTPDEIARHKTHAFMVRDDGAPALFRQRLVTFDEGAEHIAAVALRFAAFADVVADLPQVVGTLVLIPAHCRALHRLQQVFERDVLL